MGSSSTDQAVLHIEQFTLANGMRVILQPDPSVPLIATHLSYDAGSSRESSRLCGLAHVCEHVSSLTPSVSWRSYPELIESIGGLTNGSTSHERISFSAVVPAYQLALALQVEASRMSHLIDGLTQAGLEAQRGVVIQEYRQRVGNRPYGRSLEFVQKLLYPPEHPYHWPPGGLPDCVGAVSRGDVEAYFCTNLTPDKAVLVLVGDFSPDKAAAEVERHFSAIEPGANRKNGHSRPHRDLPPLNGTKREVVADDVSLPRVHLAYRAPGFGEKSWYAASLLFRSLAVGRTSHLQQKLVCQAGVAQEVKAQMVTMRDASTAAFVATAAPGVEHRALEEALIMAVEELIDDDVPNASLCRAQKKALTDHFSMMQRADSRAEFIASSAIFCEDPARVAVEDEYYRRVTPFDVSEFARTSCRKEKSVVLSLVPRGDI